MSFLLGRALRPGQVSEESLAASLAEESDFEGTDDERQVGWACEWGWRVGWWAGGRVDELGHGWMGGQVDEYAGMSVL